MCNFKEFIFFTQILDSINIHIVFYINNFLWQHGIMENIHSFWGDRKLREFAYDDLFFSGNGKDNYVFREMEK